ncbi:MAG: hypothetical protein AAGJ18_19145, partial [Bacteroidota bacterium]
LKLCIEGLTTIAVIISFSSTITHPSAYTKQTELNDKELKKVLFKKFREIGISADDIVWNEQGHLEVRNSDALELHTIMRHVEQLGFNLKMTRQTLIEVC